MSKNIEDKNEKQFIPWLQTPLIPFQEYFFGLSPLNLHPSW